MLLDESSNSIIKAEKKQSAKSRLQITNSTNRKKSAPDYPDADFPLENSSNMSTFSNNSNYFKTNNLSKVLLNYNAIFDTGCIGLQSCIYDFGLH